MRGGIYTRKRHNLTIHMNIAICHHIKDLEKYIIVLILLFKRTDFETETILKEPKA